MSHNKITVQGQNPDSSGNVSLASLNIGDLNNVTISSPTTDQVIKYNGAGWANGSVPAQNMEYILLGQGESAAYSTSNASSLAVGEFIELYDTSPLNTISGATLNISTGDWYDSITLPIGKYKVIAQTLVEFSASGRLVSNLATSAGTVKSSSLLIGDNASSYAVGVASTINSFMEMTTSTTVGLRIFVASNIDTIANQGNTIAEHTFILIVKVA